MKIYVVDDERIIRVSLADELKDEGFEVMEFAHAAPALLKMKEEQPDIVITDLKMEGVDGMQFLTAVKEKSPDTEVIVITGFATMETAKESFQKGVFDFVAKPFKISVIREVVKKAEKKRKGAKT